MSDLRAFFEIHAGDPLQQVAGVKVRGLRAVMVVGARDVYLVLESMMSFVYVRGNIEQRARLRNGSVCSFFSRLEQDLMAID